MTHLLNLLLALSIADAALPPLSAANMFTHIDLHTITQCLRLNREFKTHLCTVQQLYPGAAHVSLALEEARELYRAWDYLDDALRTTYSSHIRRTALMHLRDIIGQEAFDRGDMPFPLPRWALGAIR